LQTYLCPENSNCIINTTWSESLSKSRRSSDWTIFFKHIFDI
jgi:hypothetical protein